MGACGNKQNVAAVTQPAGKTADDATVAAPQEPSVEASASTDGVLEASAIQNDAPLSDEAPATVAVDEAIEDVAEQHGSDVVSPAVATVEPSPGVAEKDAAETHVSDMAAPAAVDSALAEEMEAAASEMGAAVSVSTAASMEETIKPLGETKLPVESKDFEPVVDDVETLPVTQSWWRCM